MFDQQQIIVPNILQPVCVSKHVSAMVSSWSAAWQQVQPCRE